ncbi:hypothetical protein B0A49_08059 [Cryomyces minteri]|uniref:Peptidase A1 domain-containing protein n=1 Tax=Cryomyces minteri TaxID=331657 RepID=A0A4U0WYJ4_9PEZI|nr:hypothetical protein B0A49_08059 [Cryomyces minteri]
MILTPAVHWDVDVTDIVHLTPRNAAPMYYSEGTSDSAKQHQFASMEMNYTVPDVNLDHSAFATPKMDSGNMVITFSTATAFQHAQTTWITKDGLLLITYIEGCGDFPSERCYYQVSSLDFTSTGNTLAAVAQGNPVKAEDIVDHLTFKWGTYKPSGQIPVAVITTTVAPTVTPRPSNNPSLSTTSSGANSSSITTAPIFAPSLASSSGSGNDNLTTATCSTTDPKYNFTMAALGSNFDTDLDDCLGYYYELTATYPITAVNGLIDNYYYELTSTSFAAYVASIGGDDDAVSYYQEDNSTDLHGDIGLVNSTDLANTTSRMSRRALARRGLTDIIQKAAAALPVKVAGLNTPITKSIRKQYDFKLPKNQTVVKSPWGDAVLIKEFGKKSDTANTNSKGSSSSSASAGISFYCVECGAQGSVTFDGKASFSVDKGGVYEGHVGAVADINVGFQLGIDAQATYKYNFKQPLGDIPLSPLTFGIVTVGPMISIGTDVDFNAAAQGQVLAGAKFVLQNAKVAMDLINPDRSGSSGWTSEFTPVLQASGNIALSAEIGFPIGIECGVSVGTTWKKTAAVVERPSIEAKAQFSGVISKNGTSVQTKITTTDGCAGIATQITFKNWLYASIFGLKNFDLMKPYSKTLTKGCIALPSKTAKPLKRLRIRQDNSTSVAFSNTTSTSNNSTFVDITDESSLATSTVEWNLPDFSNNGFNTTDNYLFTSLVDTTGTFMVSSCADGNLCIQSTDKNTTLEDNSCSVSWTLRAGSVVTDGLARLPHYYSNTMTTLGVSRLRVSDQYSIPYESVYVNFSPDPSGTYYALDQANNLLYPVVCSYSDTSLPPKVFVVADPVAGLAMLQNPDLEYVVTGGPIDTCYFLPMVQDRMDKGDDFDDVTNVDQSDEGGDSEYDSIG